MTQRTAQMNYLDARGFLVFTYKYIS